MAFTYNSAGVYVRELDLSQVIASVNTSIGAIVLAAKKGPVDKPYLVTSTKDFEDRYGTPDPTISFGHYCANPFLEVSNRLMVLRVVGTGATYSGLLMQKLTAGSTNTVFGYASADPVGLDFTQTINGGSTTEHVAYFYAEGPGSYGSSIQIQIDSLNMLPPVVTATQHTTGGSLAAGTFSYRVVAITASTNSAPSTAATTTFASGTANSVELTWPAIANATGYKVYGRTGSGELLLATVGGGTLTWTDTGALTPAGALPSQVTTDEFTVKVFDTAQSAGVPAEVYQCCLTNKLDGYGQQMELTQRINPFSRYIRVNSNAPTITSLPTIYPVTKTALTAGASGSAVTNSQIASGWTTHFSDVESTTVNILINGGYSNPTVQLAMDTVATTRGDAVAILDVPSTQQTMQLAMDYRNITLNLNSNRSGLYAPDVLIQDNYNNMALYVPPSGYVAAVFARTDYLAQPWYAPAGLNRGLLSVQGVRYKYNQGQRDQLAPSQVNYIRNFPGNGIAVWEQHTLQARMSALSWMSVRRLLDVIEVSVSKFLLYSVHEPNDDWLRTQIVGAITEFLEAIRLGRGINSYYVKCDAFNNPSYITGQGQLNVDVYIEPTLPAEKIQLRTIITRQGVDFQELIASGAGNL